MSTSMPLSEVLDNFFSIYRKRFWTIAGICAVPSLISFACTVLVQILSRGANSNPDRAALVSAITVFSVFGARILDIIAGATLSMAVWWMLTGKIVSVKSAYKRSFSRLLSLIGVGILSGLAIGIGLIALIVPGVILYLGFSLSTLIVLAEDAGVMESLSRSWDLTRGIRLRILLASILCFLLMIVVGLIFNSPAVAIASLSASHQFGYWVTFCSDFSAAIGQTLAMPILAITMAIIYFDVRKQREGLDVSLILESLPDRPPATSEPALG